MTAVSALGSWLLTYLVHSTLLLGGVALLTRWFVERETLRETLWKAALVGGVVTATLATSVPRPGVARMDLAALGTAGLDAGSLVAEGESSEQGDPGVPESDRADAPERDVDADIDADVEVDTEIDVEADGDARIDGAALPDGARDEGGDPVSSVAGGAAGGPSGGAGGGPGAPGTGAAVDAGPAVWLAVLVWLWAGVALVLLGRLAWRHLRLRWLLRDRTQVPGTEPAAVALTELRRTAGVWKPVRLTSTPAVGTPLALGAVEVCVPERLLEELDPSEQRAALAHELAHLARRDPVWQLAGSIVGALFFFQPLNGLARRRIRASAEYLADGWAVSQTGSQVELARCLAAVAGWVAPAREPALAGTMAMAEGGSPLLARVQRLLEREPESPAGPAMRGALAVAVVAVAAGFAPAVGPASAATDAEGEGTTFTERLGDGVREGVREGLAEALDELGVPDADSSRTGGPDSPTPDASPAKPAQDPLDVRMFDGRGREGDSFVARLNEAERDARQTPHWVAYAIPSDRATGERVTVTDSEAWSTRELRGEPLEHRLGVAERLADGPDGLLVLVRLAPEGAATRVERITVRDPRLGMRIGGPVYWLGMAQPVESFRWLRDIQIAAWSEDIREAAVEAIGYHDTPETEPFLLRVLEDDEESDVRESAVEALAERRQDPELAMLLFEVALNDPQGGVRHEATEQLARMESGLAVELLERLANESRDPDVQRQAAESLGEVGTDAARQALQRLVRAHPSEQVQREALDQLTDLSPPMDGAALLEVAMTADDEDLRREAVELMEELPPGEAVSVLARAVFESGDGTVERQAAESLGNVGTPEALEVLLAVLRRNPSEDASFQAVESIAENYPRPDALPVLREVLRDHPSERVRREALDAVGDLGG
jgi:HEAT repeat protein/beta-lactamase regulating signal transducer with metallopeptidase domain